MVPMAFIEFLSPDRLWLLLLIPLVSLAYYLLLRRRKARAARTGPSNLQFLLPRERGWMRHLAVGLAVMSLLTLTVAFARPKQTVLEDRQRATIIVTIDVSKSMEAEDISPNRLEAAKIAATEFVDNLPNGFNVGLVTFAGTADISVNPTTDKSIVVAAIQELTLRPSTAIGEGIYTSLQALASIPPDPNDPNAKVPARIVLMSDGATQTGRPSAQAAQEAKKLGVPVYAIAFGTQDGYIVSGNQREPVPVDEAEMANIAKISGGRAYLAESAGELREVYRDIGQSVGKEEVDKEVTPRYAGIGLLFAILASLGVASLAARWP